MKSAAFQTVRTGQVIPRGQVPCLPLAAFRETVVQGIQRGQRVAALFGDVANDGRSVDLYAVLADSARGRLRCFAADRNRPARSARGADDDAERESGGCIR